MENTPPTPDTVTLTKVIHTIMVIHTTTRMTMRINMPSHTHMCTALVAAMTIRTDQYNPFILKIHTCQPTQRPPTPPTACCG